MTLNEAAYNLLNLLRNGRASTSEELSLEQIKFNVLYYRALLIRRGADRRQNLTSFEQTVPVEIDLISPHFPKGSKSVFVNNFFDTSGSGIPIKLAESLRDIPSLVRLRDGEAVSYVGPPHFGGSYQFIQMARAASSGHSRYTSDMKRAFLDGGKLYLLNPTFDSGEISVVLRGVFEDPRAAHNFGVTEQAALDGVAVDVSDLWDDDANTFPCSMDLYQRITQSLLSGEYRLIEKEEE